FNQLGLIDLDLAPTRLELGKTETIRTAQSMRIEQYEVLKRSTFVESTLDFFKFSAGRYKYHARAAVFQDVGDLRRGQRRIYWHSDGAGKDAALIRQDPFDTAFRKQRDPINFA